MSRFYKVLHLSIPKTPLVQHQRRAGITKSTVTEKLLNGRASDTLPSRAPVSPLSNATRLHATSIADRLATYTSVNSKGASDTPPVPEQTVSLNPRPLENRSLNSSRASFALPSNLANNSFDIPLDTPKVVTKRNVFKEVKTRTNLHFSRNLIHTNAVNNDQTARTAQLLTIPVTSQPASLEDLQANLKKFHKNAQDELRTTLINAVTSLTASSWAPETDQKKFLGKFKSLIDHNIDEGKKYAQKKLKVFYPNIKSDLKSACLDILEDKHWRTMNSSILDESGRPFYNRVLPNNALTSFSIHSASNEQVHLGFNNDTKPLAKDKGVSCYSNNRNTNHAANVWLTSLKDEGGNNIFSGLRHASLSSPNLKTSEERKNAAYHKARDLIQAAIYSKHKATIENALNNHTVPSEALELRLTSISLLTLLDLKIGVIDESEKTQFYDQKQALEALARELKEFTIDGLTFPVKIQFLQFNTGVNNVAMGQSKGKLFHRAHWKEADIVNKTSLETLLGENAFSNNLISGWVGEYLTSLGSELPDKQIQIQLLANEIIRIFNNNEHHKETNGRYELGKRIAYLAYLIDAVPAFNCKSGKDRTGIMDAEIKALAIQMQTSSSQSGELSTKVSPELRKRVYLDPINYQIQQLNSGTTGNKVMNSDSEWLKNELGKDVYETVKGNCNTHI